MAVQKVEIDIQPDGSIKATPNPVGAATDDILLIHIHSNQSEKPRVTITFKGDTKGPFGTQDSGVDCPATQCNGPTHGIKWPEGGTQGKVTVEVHGSPVVASAEITVYRIAFHEEAATTSAPCVVNNYYFCKCCCKE